MELALSFEKLNFQKLKELQGIAEKNKDAQMSDFVEGMLQEQVGIPCFFAHILVPRTVHRSNSPLINVNKHISGRKAWKLVVGFSCLDC